MSNWHITGQLKLTSGLHIGTGKGGDVTDSAVRRNSKGELVIPGRAIGGSLRTLATRLAPRLFAENALCVALKPPTNTGKMHPVCGCVVCALFGTVNFRNDADEGHASPLWVYDAMAQSATHIRDGVGIDRRRKTASRNVKFDYEVAPSGTEFALKMRLQPLPEQDVTSLRTLLQATLAEWEAGRGQLGGNVARGLGQFVLDGLNIEEERMGSAEALIDYLLHDNPENFRKSTSFKWRDQIKSLQPTTDPHVAQAFVKIKFKLNFTDFYLSNDPLVAMLSGFDHAPLVELIHKPKHGVGKPVLSGSSLRGALRSHAEKIARTLATLHYQDDPQSFLANCPACDVLQNAKEEPLTSCDKRLRIDDNDEVPTVALCLSCQLFGSQRRGSRLWVRDAELVAEGKLGAVDWKVQDFLAIDPFTGGGKEKAKFDAAPLVGQQFQTEITLHNPTEWELGWLTLLLRDLHEGYLTLGFGSAKGYGRVQAQQIRWSLGWFTQADLAFMSDVKPTSKSADKGAYTVSNDEATGYLPQDWQTVAQGWIDQFNKIIQTPFTHDDWQGQTHDTFFETMPDMVALYGISRVEVNHG